MLRSGIGDQAQARAREGGGVLAHLQRRRFHPGQQRRQVGAALPLPESEQLGQVKGGTTPRKGGGARSYAHGGVLYYAHANGGVKSGGEGQDAIETHHSLEQQFQQDATRAEDIHRRLEPRAGGRVARERPLPKPLRRKVAAAAGAAAVKVKRKVGRVVGGEQSRLEVAEVGELGV